MLRLKKVVVTGGLSCGKSLVCQIMGDFGAYIVSADEIVHRMLSSNYSLQAELVKLLGDDIIENGFVNKNKIRKIVSQNSYLLNQMEAIIHPKVYDQVEAEYPYQTLKGVSPQLFMAEIPLYFESHCEINFDFIITVWAKNSLCQQRFDKLHGQNSDWNYCDRSQRLMPIETKISLSDFNICNEGSIEQLKTKLLVLYQSLTSNFIK